MKNIQSQRYPICILSVSLVQVALFLIITICSSSSTLLLSAEAALIPPARFDGFVYNKAVHGEDTIAIEAFFDPVCPDSRDAWAPLKSALQHYGSRVSLVVHPFPLPYHDNAFVTSRALHIVNSLNPSATYHTLELFFKHQEKFYNKQTHELSRATIVDQVVKLVADATGNTSLSALESGFNNRKTDLMTRVSFKYGCTRGVFGTPFFFVNGFSLPDSGSAIDYKGWRNIIDPLLVAQGQKNEGAHRSFL
ncbi:hypothetical protein C5167_032508 [Papaver somniferum]|uniref:Thioredoxin-like fold domain-containing protein n=1 Tax=Papaver somniferum TaxID=3469 RepID=A0A4Y7KAQ6_PAPSO|nr:uncharacterized protein LOC113297473 [Papaver somniferum]RZC69422.1 hypothetical protein C5167_032508 [Papaver somniferum]